MIPPTLRVAPKLTCSIGLLILGACATTRGAEQIVTAASADEARDAALALFEYVTEAFPAAWGGVPAEVYCVDGSMLKAPSALGELATRIRPAAECRFELRRGAPPSEQRVRHIETGRPAVIYTFREARKSPNGEVSIDFTWFGAHHYSGGYRCILVREGTAWRTTECGQTSSYHRIG